MGMNEHSKSRTKLNEEAIAASSSTDERHEGKRPKPPTIIRVRPPVIGRTTWSVTPL